MTGGFWPPVGADPVIDNLYAAHHWRADDLPATALQLLDRLREIGYRISKLEDLHLEHADGEVRVETLGGDVDETAAIGAGQGSDGGLDVARTADTAHEGSSRCDEGAGTPGDRTVEVATDIASVAGTGRGTLGPGRSAPHPAGVEPEAVAP